MNKYQIAALVTTILYILSMFFCYWIVSKEVKRRKLNNATLFPEVEEFAAIFISVCPIWNTYIVLLQIQEYIKHVRTTYKQVKKLDGIAQRMGFRSMHQLLKHEEKKRKDEQKRSTSGNAESL